MIFLLTTVDETGQTREFSSHLDKLERGFDLANEIVAMGHVLLRVRLIDQDTVMNLPLDAFTGESFSDNLQQLEQEWKAILQTPVGHQELARQTHRQDIQRRLALYEARIASTEGIISRLMALIERARQLEAIKGRGGQFVQHYQSLVDSFDKQLTQIYQMRHQLQQRLHQLEDELQIVPNQFRQNNSWRVHYC